MSATATSEANSEGSLPDPSTAGLAVFLDVDGTLLELSPTPDSVTVPPELPGVLTSAAGHLGGALALVSGRSLDSLDSLFGALAVPMAALHGLEIRRDGIVRRPDADPAMAGQKAALQAAVGDIPGVLIEDKGACVAVHYRQCPTRQDEVETAVMAALGRLGDGFQVLAGKMVYELKPKTADKGHAVAQLMQAPPFRGRRPVYFGDDVTDEDAFRAVNAMGGVSVRIGAAGVTAAGTRLDDVSAVRRWLMEMVGAMPSRMNDEQTEKTARP